MSRGEAIFTALEHEAMHQETLLYMWRRLPYAHKRKPQGVHYELDAAPLPNRRVDVPAGHATLGARRDRIPFGWDNEFGELTVPVPAFDIDAHSVTNAEYLQFIGDGGYERRDLWDDAGWEWREGEKVSHPAFWVPEKGGARAGSALAKEQWAWRGMFEDIPLPPAWPVYVSQAEASAYARWLGRRLPSEGEFHRAAFGTPTGSESPHPWGASDPAPHHGNFDFTSWEPVPAGARPQGASAWGVQDLVGNGWEWTGTEFGPFPGFEPMPSYPEYSAEFFDGRHVVLKGASPATARELIRPSFRNWFRTNYPYVYAKFRTVSNRQAGQ
jgi:ergothioneine biosynthesis protein EgtB